MVYSQICSWVEDYLQENEPEELLDNWDFMEWIRESEICDIFYEVVLPTFKSKRARDDATHILMSVLWEYYLFRGDTTIGILDTQLLSAELSEYPQSHAVLFADEFWRLMDEVSGSRLSLIREKVFMGSCTGKTIKKEYSDAIVRLVYESSVADSSLAKLANMYHTDLSFLATGSGWMVKQGMRAGRLVLARSLVQKSIVKDVIPADYYSQLQIQMETYGIEAADFVECKLRFGDTFDATAASGPSFVGAVAFSSTTYELSPLFDDTETGRKLAQAWKCSDPDSIVKLWQIDLWQVQSCKRNRRWWSSVGRDAVVSFWSDVQIGRQDPLYYVPAYVDFDVILSDEPLFLDD